ISEAELKARASGLGKGGEGETAGLYHAGIKLVIRSDLGAAYDRRQECFWLTKVVVEVSLTERTIFVIKELKSGGCFYNVVLAHERRHQAIDDDVFHTHGEAVVNVLSREIGKMTPWIMVPIEDAAEGQKTLLAKVQAVAEGAVQKIADQRNARETALDTVEEYRRMGSACPPE
ncbi:MAG TPA: hypothetical protein VKT70_12975, partial [Stellaceae bacterium]|nr:hypothetical protein [Stellaceae bacterium]